LIPWFSGYFGDALAPEKGDCKPCDCYHLGTTETGFGPLACDQLTGQCQCKPHVIGVNCDQCEAGHYNIASGDVSFGDSYKKCLVAWGHFWRQIFFVHRKIMIICL